MLALCLPTKSLENMKVCEYEKYIMLNDNVVNTELTDISAEMVKLMDKLVAISDAAEKDGIRDRYNKRKQIDRLKQQRNGNKGGSRRRSGFIMNNSSISKSKSGNHSSKRSTSE